MESEEEGGGRSAAIEFEVEDVLEVGRQGKGRVFLVRWKDYLEAVGAREGHLRQVAPRLREHLESRDDARRRGRRWPGACPRLPHAAEHAARPHRCYMAPKKAACGALWRRGVTKSASGWWGVGELRGETLKNRLRRLRQRVTAAGKSQPDRTPSEKIVM